MIELLLRLLWFYLIGLWLGSLWLGIAWLCCVSIILFPVGIWMIHRAPAIFTLKQEGKVKTFEYDGKAAYYLDEMEQPNLLIRMLWFVFFGWWVSGIWITVASALAATFIGLPVAFWMINRLPFIVTLHRG